MYTSISICIQGNTVCYIDACQVKKIVQNTSLDSYIVIHSIVSHFWIWEHILYACLIVPYWQNHTILTMHNYIVS